VSDHGDGRPQADERAIAAGMAECRRRPAPGPARRRLAGWLRGLADRLAPADGSATRARLPRARS